MTVLSRNQVLQSLLPGLNQLFDQEYQKYNLRHTPLYTMKFRYGKYSIYKTEYSIEFDRMNSTTLAKGLDKNTATAMMKLLENTDE